MTCPAPFSINAKRPLCPRTKGGDGIFGSGWFTPQRSYGVGKVLRRGSLWRETTGLGNVLSAHTLSGILHKIPAQNAAQPAEYVNAHLDKIGNSYYHFSICRKGEYYA